MIKVMDTTREQKEVTESTRRTRGQEKAKWQNDR